MWPQVAAAGGPARDDSEDGPDLKSGDGDGRGESKGWPESVAELQPGMPGRPPGLRLFSSFDD